MIYIVSLPKVPTEWEINGTIKEIKAEFNMKNYYRIMLGQKSRFAKECFDGNFFGTDFLVTEGTSCYEC